jgi:hypothetical protein
MSADDAPSGREATPPAGWYADPWARGQRRFWDGTSWTRHAFPEAAGPGAPAGWPPASTPPSAPPTKDLPGAGPPPPEWWKPAPQTQQLRSSLPAPPPPPPGRGAGWWPPRGKSLVALAVVLAFIVGVLGGLIVFRNKGQTPSASNPPGSGPTALPNLGGLGASPSPTPAGDPSASLLDGLVLQQSDVGVTETVQVIPDGRSLTSATLDLCNGTYPSESLRTARLQVAGYDPFQNELLSTEAVLYRSPAATAQAFSELTSVTAHCPNAPVTSPVGEPTVTTVFGPPPDGSWPQVAGVQRQAYSLTMTDTSGGTQQSIAVYLRRGRALLGVYFPLPQGPQAPVDGQTTIPAIVNLFANRMAQLPASQIGA